MDGMFTTITELVNTHREYKILSFQIEFFHEI